MCAPLVHPRWVPWTILERCHSPGRGGGARSGRRLVARRIHRNPGHDVHLSGQPEAPRLLEEAYEIYERSGYAEFAAWYWWGTAVLAQHQGRDDEALAAFERAIQAADAVGELVSSGTAHGFRALLRADRGEGSLAAAELPPVVERAIAAGAGLAMPALLAGTTYAQASIGQLEQARDSMAWYVEANIGGGPYANASVLTGIARIELLLDQPEKAAEHAQQAADINDRQLRNPLIAATARQRLAAAALLRGGPSNAESLAHEALATTVEHGFKPLILQVLDVLAGVAVALESFEESARILGAAERAREELGHVRWDREQEKFEALEQRVRAQLGENATTELEAGRAITTDEAIGWLRRARGTRKRPAGGWESLTPTELQVVKLAGQGLTNPEIAARMFVSRGTVKVHLSHIYSKLDVRNRSELAALTAKKATATPRP